jgi:predicted ester cyclase
MSTMSVQDNKAMVQRLVDLWNTGNLAGLDECLAADYANRDPNNPEVTGLPSYKRWAAAARAAFPDLRVRVEDLIGEGDRVTKLWSFAATHRGEFLGAAPTGRRITWSGITI